jgi:hypothetical protein
VVRLEWRAQKVGSTNRVLHQVVAYSILVHLLSCAKKKQSQIFVAIVLGMGLSKEQDAQSDHGTTAQTCVDDAHNRPKRQVKDKPNS